jgi:pyridoxal phosphate enzyme (YggS family)
MTRRDEIAKNLERVKSGVPEEVTLIVVTKTYPVSDVEILYELGIRNFGENRDQEGASKAPKLPEDCIWHFQGQIQSNKLKSIVNWADVIHSVDDIEHAKKINKLVSKPFEVFIQISLDGQDHRGGVAPEIIYDFLDSLSDIQMVKPIGLMAVAPLDENPDSAFARLAGIKAQVASEYPQIKYLSAGMSHDYQSAIEQGATHIRVGSSILGERPPLI